MPAVCMKECVLILFVERLSTSGGDFICLPASRGKLPCMVVQILKLMIHKKFIRSPPTSQNQNFEKIWLD